ncbi:MAG: CoA-binding protein [Candidatus Hydrogenedentota bacterium]|nr:MAG: CoA-binding protein [Candidatus Hydrogenedentota bacterium]
MSEILEKFAPLFNPRSIAFVGASNTVTKWGFLILFNLLEGGYKGRVYPINPREKEVMGVRAYPTVLDVPDAIDLVIIVVPPPQVLPVIKQCVEKRIPAGIVVTAGFGELGEKEMEMEREMVRVARAGGMMLTGPNCAGVMSVNSSSLYAIMPPFFPKPGHLSIASQSGNVGASMLRFSVDRDMGFNKFISTGNEADLHAEDYFEYFGEDPETHVILSYVEGPHDGRKLFEVARKVTRKKPIVMLKSGRTAAGERAARSHTGSLAGSDDIFDAMCRQAGITRVEDIEEMFDTARAMLRQPLPRGNRVGIVAAGGGWGVLAADACMRVGLDVVKLRPETLEILDEVLPPWWSRNNPVDLVAGLRPGDFVNCVETMLRSDYVDCVMALGAVGFSAVRAQGFIKSKLVERYRLRELSDLFIEEDIKTAKGMVELMDKYRKPVVVAAETVVGARAANNPAILTLENEGVLVYPTPDRAARVLARIVERSRYLSNGHG